MPPQVSDPAVPLLRMRIALYRKGHAATNRAEAQTKYQHYPFRPQLSGSAPGQQQLSSATDGNWASPGSPMMFKGPSDGRTPGAAAAGPLPGWSNTGRLPGSGGGSNSVQAAWQVFKDSAQITSGGSSRPPSASAAGASSFPDADGRGLPRGEDARRRAEVEQAADTTRLGRVGFIHTPTYTNVYSCLPVLLRIQAYNKGICLMGVVPGNASPPFLIQEDAPSASADAPPPPL